MLSMGRTRKWQATSIDVLVIDCGNRTAVNASNICDRTKFSSIQLSAVELLQQLIFFQPRTAAGLVFYGTDRTFHDLTQISSSISHVSVEHNIDRVETLALHKLKSQVPSSSCSNWLGGCIVALNMLCKFSLNRKVAKRIWLFANESSLSEDRHNFAVVARQMQLAKVDFTMFLSSFFRSGQLNDTKFENYSTIQAILHEFNGRCWSFGDLFDSPSKLVSITLPSMKRCRVILEISPFIKIAVEMHVKTKRADSPRLKRFYVSDETKKLIEARMQRYPCYQNIQTESFVAQFEQVKAYRYGNELVPCAEIDTSLLKLDTVASLVVLFSIPRSHLRCEWITENVEYLFAGEGNVEGFFALRSLIAAMFQIECALICGLVWRKNALPRLVAAIPKIGASMQCLILFNLPFSEDVRHLLLPSLPRATDEQLKIMESFMLTLNIQDNPNAPQMESSITKFNLKGMTNPCTLKLYKNVIERVLNTEVSASSSPHCKPSSQSKTYSQTFDAADIKNAFHIFRPHAMNVVA
ncbi:Ku70/Ku80 beta-barrel domain-containing protein [Cardiosporidium cionae]|uniref:Ku70/Ku80 beta-barrel domain-containing protein n=1 Tax=Cardiosporidium cionae TaxID=476202 RepID=A0ABQ7JBY2_9APIC|nr:Ku70/Ku80 beta-barrel domain-containing protein [Cardiosporidium cionae]|eukprot:KAF8821517.1 Ku70/Ku80 beta-barrel domain-containing protein [Cardiosporidium cionae]